MNSKLLDFITCHQEDLLRFCYFLCRDENAAQDLAQETFIKIIEADFEPVNSKAYVFQTAKNLFIDHKRKYTNAQNFINSLHLVPTLNPADLGVWQVLFALEPDEQEVLLLVDREGLSINEAAEWFKITESALKSRLFRARENFKKKWNN